MKKFNFLTMLFTALLMCAPLASCSNDDDEGNGNGNGGGSASNAPSTNTPLINEGRLLLTKVNVIGNDGEIDRSINMEYDSNRRAHRCYGIYNYDNESQNIFVIDYANGKINLYEDEFAGADISFNSNGYITKLKVTWDETEDGVRYYGSEDISFTYSQDGHLTEVNIIGEDHGNEQESGKEITKTTYTWDNGNLISEREYTTWYNEDGSIDEIDEDVIEYTYGEQGNRFKQYTAGISDINDAPFFVIGMCGVGPAMLPTGRKHTYKYTEGGSTHEGVSSHTSYTYTLNENGSINTETETSSYNYSLTYAYGYTSSDSYTPTKATASNAVQTRTTAVSNVMRTRALLKSLPFVPQRKSKQDKAL